MPARHSAVCKRCRAALKVLHDLLDIRGGARNDGILRTVQSGDANPAVKWHDGIRHPVGIGQYRCHFAAFFKRRDQAGAVNDQVQAALDTEDAGGTGGRVFPETVPQHDGRTDAPGPPKLTRAYSIANRAGLGV